jgi:branched-chain amino acid transport system permease protein
MNLRMDVLIQQIGNGITLGSIYALVALGLTIIYGVLYIPDFALAHKGMVGAYICYYLITKFQWNYWLATALAMLAVGILGILSEKLIYRPTLKVGHHVNAFISAFGIILFLESFALIFFGTQYRDMKVAYTDEIVRIFGITFTMQRILVVITALVFIIFLHVFFKQTRLGSAIRAVSQEPEGALLMGINVKGVSLMAMGIGSALAGLASCLIAPISMVYPAMGHIAIVKAFIVIILGGMGSIPGAIIGGYIIGLSESLGAAFVSSDFKDIFPFGALILILAIHPTGIFGKETR